MSNSKVPEAIRAAGYCCPWGYFRRNNLLSAWEIAAQLNISERSAKLWRRRYRDIQLPCERLPECIKTVPRPLRA